MFKNYPPIRIHVCSDDNSGMLRNLKLVINKRIVPTTPALQKRTMDSFIRLVDNGDQQIKKEKISECMYPLFSMKVSFIRHITVWRNQQ